MAIITGVSKAIEDDLLLSVTDNDISETIICKRADKLSELIKLVDDTPKNIHFISDGYFSLYDLVMALVNKLSPVNLYITTYALREFATKQLITGINNKLIENISILLETRIKTRDDVYELAKMNFSKVGLTSLHAKVTVIKSSNSYITITGSANWTKNERIENGIISTQKEVAEFHIDWIEKKLANVELFK